MGKFDKALIKQKQPTKVDKAYMNAKNIPFKADFSLKTTVWVPKAQPNKPCPNPVLVVNVGDDALSINAKNVNELKEALYNIIAFLDHSEYEIERVLDSERKNWIKHQQKYLDNLQSSEEELNQDTKIISIKTAN
jgi:hypothetical protein